MFTITDDKKLGLERLCVRFRVRSLAIFGSASGESFRPGESDLDFLVELDSSEQLVDRYFGLLEGLEDLFGIPIDLLRTSAVRNPYLKKSIEASKIDLYAA